MDKKGEKQYFVKGKEKLEQWGRCFNDKKIAVIMAVLLFATILPMLIVAKYSHASADDFGWGAEPRKIWQETHSLKELVGAAYQVTVNMYYGWQGTYSGIFIGAFQPEIFNVKAYFIVPYIMLFFFCGGTAFLLYYILVKILKFRKSVFTIVAALYFFISIQYVPSTGEAFYWYNGATLYTLIYGVAMFSLYFCLKYIFEGRKFNLFMSIFGAVIVGGGNYLTIVLFPLLLLLIFALFVKSHKRVITASSSLFVFMAAAIVNMKAPGLMVRGGNDFGFDISRIFKTIGRAVYEGLKGLRSDYLGNPVIVTVMVLMVLFIVAEMLEHAYEFSFKYPFLFLLMTFGSYLAMYAPTYYAGAGHPFGRISNLITFYFELSIIFDAVYVTGWCMRVFKEKGSRLFDFVCRTWKAYKIYVLALAVLFILMHPAWCRMSTVVRTVQYLASGEAKQYGEEMEARYQILLDDSMKDVELEPISVSAGVLFNYDIVEDPEGWPNTVMAYFFNKNSVKLKVN